MASHIYTYLPAYFRAADPKLTNCCHDFDPEPPSWTYITTPTACIYCNKWVWGSTRDLWQCTVCRSYTHKKCVPTPLRLATLRKECDVGPSSIVLLRYDKKLSDDLHPANGSAYTPSRAPSLIECHSPSTASLPDTLSDSDSDGTPCSSYETFESVASLSIDFEFPTQSRKASRCMRERDKHEVSVTTIKSVLQDCMGDRGLRGIRWSFSDLRKLCGVHHRRYLRRLQWGTTITSPSFIDCLSCAFRYAKGAYGNGRLTDAVVKNIPFDPKAYMLHALAMLGWDGQSPSGKLLHWSWLPKGAGFHTPGYYVGVDYTHRHGVVGVRGTLFASDVYIDVNGSPTAFLTGKAHTGVVEATRQMYEEIRDLLLDKFHPSRRGEYAGWPLVLSGHSLGGAVVACLALLLIRDGVADDLSLQCYGFGAPPVLSEDLARSLTPYMHTVVNGKDMCPRMALSNWDALAVEMLMPSGLWGCHHIPAAVAAVVGVVTGCCEGKGVGLSPIRPSATQPQEGFVSAGQVYVIHNAERDSDEIDIVSALRDTPRYHPHLFKLKGNDLGGVCLSMQMISSHPWRAYGASIARLYDAYSTVAIRPEMSTRQTAWSWGGFFTAKPVKEGEDSTKHG
eukprot:Sspe_Gene.5850::Locus_1950_Transcript_1_1_Confidence_1.000_Length_2124::g.5850::m.5850